MYLDKPLCACWYTTKYMKGHMYVWKLMILVKGADSSQETSHVVHFVMDKNQSFYC